MVRALLTAVLSAAMSLVAVGCADEAGDGALRIIRNEFVDETCSVTGAATALGRPRGIIEVVSPNDYVITPVVQNYATSSSGKYTSQRTAFLEGARVDLEFTDPTLFTAAELTQMQTDGLTKFSSPFSAAVLPDNSTSGTIFSIIPTQLLAKIAPQLSVTRPSVTVTARMRVYGQMGGGEVESESFFFPVQVCDSRIPGSSCVISTLKTACTPIADPRIGNPCNSFQDAPVDCCQEGNAIVCPTPAT
jgi:hypothetical protein